MQFKDQLNGGDDPHTKDGALNFPAVKQALRGEGNWKLLYDVFGVVEMWNESMALFDESMPLDGESWITASEKSRNDHGSGAWKHDELNALAQARKDPVVLEAISALNSTLWKQISMLSILLLTSATPQTLLAITIRVIDLEHAHQIFLTVLPVALTLTICPEVPLESTLRKNSTSRLTSMR